MKQHTKLTSEKHLHLQLNSKINIEFFEMFKQPENIDIGVENKKLFFNSRLYTLKNLLRKLCNRKINTYYISMFFF